MESSDEEGEIFPDCVTNYYFVNGTEEPVSFSSLPLQLDNIKCNTKSGSGGHLFLRGFVDGGCQQIYKKVVAWKFDLSYVLPEVFVHLCSSQGRWIKLQKPRKSYEGIIRTVLVSVHCLHFMKRNSERGLCREALWKHVRSTFSTYEVAPSEIDLADHLEWIREAAVRDKNISKAKNLHSFLSEMSRKRKASAEEKSAEKKLDFIVSDDLQQCDDGGDDDEYSDELFDRVCALCDDGGDILGCEGRCIRSFHMTVESGSPSLCESLCYSSKEVEAIQTFLCKNCKHQRHQCFICGELGSSDRSSGAEVFPCVSATCGHFYHPQCVSKRMFPDNHVQAQAFQNRIEGGDSFICPAHSCLVCGKGEDKSNDAMQFAICRRCPKAYHRKCLPRNILFMEDIEKGTPRRAWEGLLTKRILIYCRDHQIARNIFTPKRDHLLFPDVCGKKQGVNLLSETRSKPYGILGNTNDLQNLHKRRNDDVRIEKSLEQKVSRPALNSNALFQTDAVSNRVKPNNLIKLVKSKVPQNDDQSVSMRTMKPGALQRKDDQSAFMRTMKIAPPQQLPPDCLTASETAEIKNRVRNLMKSSTSSLSEVEFLNEQRLKYGQSYSSSFSADKAIPMGMVECSVEAIEAALKKLDKGGSIDEAKAVCEPGVLIQMMKWKKKLSVYLSPFLHGNRYTSFGRHFTNVDKLEQIVNRLCWYAQDGDTIADFCCGSNDFSLLMKKRLESMGRRCYFKNFDRIQPKNDFNFVKRDWMTVGLDELPEGSNLIMGLNPPFSIANQFINKALTFSPKLLILIVPKDTESLDRKKYPYDLIWKDDQICSGKSFYLPGSIDVNNQQLLQWNIDAPPLYLWSRPDWTMKHRSVAIKQGHITSQETECVGGSGGSQGSEDMECSEGSGPVGVTNYLLEEHHDCYGDFSSIATGYDDINRMLDDLPEASG